MNDWATLITAIGTLVTALGGAFGVVVTAIKSGQKQAAAAAERAASEVDDEQSRRIAELEDRIKRLTGGSSDQ